MTYDASAVKKTCAHADICFWSVQAPTPNPPHYVLTHARQEAFHIPPRSANSYYYNYGVIIIIVILIITVIVINRMIHIFTGRPFLTPISNCIY